MRPESSASSRQGSAATKAPPDSAWRCPLGLSDCDLVAGADSDGDPIDMHWYAEDSPDPCFICKDPTNHYGHDHGKVTGDGRTRADCAASEVDFQS